MRCYCFELCSNLRFCKGLSKCVSHGNLCCVYPLLSVGYKTAAYQETMLADIFAKVSIYAGCRQPEIWFSYVLVLHKTTRPCRIGHGAYFAFSGSLKNHLNCFCTSKNTRFWL